MGAHLAGLFRHCACEFCTHEIWPIPYRAPPPDDTPAGELTDRQRVFYVHQNGDRPFRVEIIGSQVNLYRATGSTCRRHLFDSIFEEKPYRFFKARSMWVGRSPEGWRITVDSSPATLGNTILIRIDSHNYVLIGGNILHFCTKVPICEFFSPVGNNNVPYPFARDEKGTMYFFDDYRVTKPKAGVMDPWEYFYNEVLYIGPRNLLPQPEGEGFRVPRVRFRNIWGIRCGAEEFMLTWQHDPCGEYKSLLARFGGPISLVTIEDELPEVVTMPYEELESELNARKKITPLSEKEYAAIMHDHGEVHGLQTLKYMDITPGKVDL